MQGNDQHSEESEGVYIILCAGSQWRDVYRLVEGHCLTIGRESSNRIAVSDDRCSRRHCEIFFGPGGWLIRDLGSSNGTDVNGKKIAHPTALEEGDLVKVGNSTFLFTHDLTQPLAADELESLTAVDSPRNGVPDSGTHTEIDPQAESDETLSDLEDFEPEILNQKARSRYVEGPPEQGLREGFAGLYRLVADMVTANDLKQLAVTVLSGLFDVVNPDIGAILLLPSPASGPGKANANDLRIMSFRAPDDAPYHRISDRLSDAALKQGDGTLSMNVGGEGASAGSFQTLENMNAQSVICAPIRDGNTIQGLVHLYSLSPDRTLDDEALDFTLAVAEQMAKIVARLREQADLAEGLEAARQVNQSLREMLEIESDLIGTSETMRILRDEIGRFAVSDATALVRGESGVGKELVARAIHFNSPRNKAPFVCLNCAALTETLLESELFGHEKGSFTGATERKSGKFEQADGGTLFLDEVGEMPLQIQAKFLRVLEGHAFERVGGHTSVEVNVRVVAATNRDLEQAVREGEFRRDLFFRLNILEIEVPLLRDRRDDIAELIPHFLERCSRTSAAGEKKFSAEALDLMTQYDWPGNVRELRNTIERAYAIARGDTISEDEIRFSSLEGTAPQSAEAGEFRPLSMKEIEKRHIQSTMHFTKWVKREAARLLGIERSTLDRKLKSYGIDRPEES
jgi:Nif-specific regulatory protein